MSIVNIICTFIIAIIGWKLSIKLSESSGRINKVNNILIKRISDIEEYSSILKAVPDIVLSNKSDHLVIQSEMGKKTSGISLDVNGTLRLNYGRISQVYICWRNDKESSDLILSYDTVWNSHKDVLVKSVDINKKLYLSKETTFSNVLANHFYLIIVDESKLIHRILVEIISDTYAGSDGKSLFVDTNGMNKARMDYRTFNDDEILVYDHLSQKKPWINADSGNEETNYQKKEEEWDKWLDNYDKLNEANLENEVKKINSHFALVGLK